MQLSVRPVRLCVCAPCVYVCVCDCAAAQLNRRISYICVCTCVLRCVCVSLSVCMCVCVCVHRLCLLFFYTHTHTHTFPSFFGLCDLPSLSAATSAPQSALTAMEHDDDRRRCAAVRCRCRRVVARRWRCFCCWRGAAHITAAQSAQRQRCRPKFCAQQQQRRSRSSSK